MSAPSDLHTRECVMHGEGDERIALLTLPNVHDRFLAPLSEEERQQVHDLLSEASAQAELHGAHQGLDPTPGRDPLQPIFRKLGVTSRRQLVVAALRSGVQPGHDPGH